MQQADQHHRINRGGHGETAAIYQGDFRHLKMGGRRRWGRRLRRTLARERVRRGDGKRREPRAVFVRDTESAFSVLASPAHQKGAPDIMTAGSLGDTAPTAKALFNDAQLFLIRPAPTAPRIGDRKDLYFGSVSMVGHSVGSTTRASNQKDGPPRRLTQCLINQPDPTFRNLANLRHLVLGFDAHVAPQGQLGAIDRFVLSATQTDQNTFAAYRAFVQGNLKTIQSVLMTADVALDAVATPEMAALTGTNTLDFAELRQRPTAMFVIVNQTQMELYAFLLSLFYADLFKALLKDPQNPGRPVWLFLDEFGHLQIPGFEVFATTSRKYKVSYALFLQSLAQLEGRYGLQNARTIIEGLGTEIYLPGTSLETARNLEARLGRTPNAPLMAANDIIRMDENEALMLYSNRLPILLKTKRYFQRGDLRRRANISPATFPQSGGRTPQIIQL